jgi:hypothetical protein
MSTQGAIKPDELTCLIGLHEWLAATLGGTPDQIHLAKSPDHLTLIVSIIPLMRLAGGKWAELVKDMP